MQTDRMSQQVSRTLSPTYFEKLGLLSIQVQNRNVHEIVQECPRNCPKNCLQKLSTKVSTKFSTKLSTKKSPNTFLQIQQLQKYSCTYFLGFLSNSYTVLELVVFLNTFGSLLSGCFAVLLAQQQFVSFNVSHKDKE